MTAGPTSADGVSRFIADLMEEGHEPTRCGDVVMYSVVPATGLFAGKMVQTAVGVSELQGWPTAPPHWIHLPDEINFVHTNFDTQNCLSGWKRHSREVGLWAMDRKPILTWISHVRCVVGQAA